MENEIVWEKGYKGFNFNFSSKCGNPPIIYEKNKIYHDNNSLKMCKNGFHFCVSLPQIMKYYHIMDNKKYRYCEIEYDSREGNVIHENDKSVTSSIRIVRELTEKQIRKLIKYKYNYKVWRNEVTKEIERENDLPAIIWYFENGLVCMEEWYKNGLRNREEKNDLPAKIEYYENGIIKEKRWYKNDKLHREKDLPAHIEYYDNGSIREQLWYKNGKYHRDNNMPAKIEYFGNGTIYYQRWFKNGKTYKKKKINCFSKCFT